jgi:hypothetical protein
MDTNSFERNLFIIRGLPNRGKTTVGNIIAPNNCYAADDYWYELMSKTGLSYREVWKPQLLGEAHKQCQFNVELAMSLGARVIAVTNTNISSKYMLAYQQLAIDYDYKVFYLVVERAHTNDNGHLVPLEAISGMAARWEWIDPEFKKEFPHGTK